MLTPAYTSRQEFVMVFHSLPGFPQKTIGFLFPGEDRQDIDHGNPVSSDCQTKYYFTRPCRLHVLHRIGVLLDLKRKGYINSVAGNLEPGKIKLNIMPDSSSTVGHVLSGWRGGGGVMRPPWGAESASDLPPALIMRWGNDPGNGRGYSDPRAISTHANQLNEWKCFLPDGFQAAYLA
jgi:hypothetical protein